MMAMSRGTVVQKAQFGKKLTKVQPRFLRLSEDFSEILWGKDLRNKRTSRKLSLKDVIRLEYGFESQLGRVLLQSGEVKEGMPRASRCFSLWTTRRSFDFAADTQEDAQTWVLGLCQLCRGSDAWVPFKTRGAFYVARTRTKVREYCQKRGISVKHALKEACLRASVFAGQGGQLPGVPNAPNASGFRQVAIDPDLFEIDSETQKALQDSSPTAPAQARPPPRGGNGFALPPPPDASASPWVAHAPMGYNAPAIPQSQLPVPAGGAVGWGHGFPADGGTNPQSMGGGPIDQQVRLPLNH
uniref:PH domain-containing protein n=1 Tax=Chromera velia CCMP2878 TaxID=1169474 RepID=A0A0G4HSR3_9ALVE|eukprot:Cvel_31059.t1-p1 / transcript=Cvel_31059.t1 / gene=Cvel_31059 / organism=Chromera_velia_CCMP2878 / gene_product=hypothetical protein / transcript_product=hypothetical protein / location=Cvel_scaffold4552:1126-5364(+) / protein_length=298 / sequence_SO=supercontig / SO=protein_coding / is_pseudo=false